MNDMEGAKSVGDYRLVAPVADICLDWNTYSGKHDIDHYVSLTVSNSMPSRPREVSYVLTDL